MYRPLLLAATAFGLAMPAFAQTITPVTPSAPAAVVTPTSPNSAVVTPVAPGSTVVTTAPSTPAATAVIGVAPLENTPPANYVAWAWDANNYEIEAAKVALARSERAEVKAYAQTMLDAHNGMLETLKGSLKNEQRAFVAPAAKLSPNNEGLLKQLRDAPKSSFDALYLTQQVAAHEKAWSLNKGFSNSGDDAALKTVAQTNVPMIETHLAQAKALLPAQTAAR